MATTRLGFRRGERRVACDGTVGAMNSLSVGDAERRDFRGTGGWFTRRSTCEVRRELRRIGDGAGVSISSSAVDGGGGGSFRRERFFGDGVGFSMRRSTFDRRRELRRIGDGDVDFFERVRVDGDSGGGGGCLFRRGLLRAASSDESLRVGGDELR